MKQVSILKLLLIAVTMGLVLVASASAEANQQYIEVTLKSGQTVHFEYRSFIEGNLSLLPERESRAPGEEKTFGEQRVIFREKGSCEEHHISLDNLETVELIGIEENACAGIEKKDWLYKVYLLDLEKYVGFFQVGEYNTDRPVAERGVKGQVLNSADIKTIPFEDITKISFFAQ